MTFRLKTNDNPQGTDESVFAGMTKGIAQSTLIEYDGAPHGLQVTHKERLTKDLLDFIQG